MIDYEQCIKNVIVSGSYTLEELEDRIDALWVEGKLNSDQRAELKKLAAENASDYSQIDIISKIADFETRIYNLEHPTDIYPIWTPGYVTSKGEIVRYDVTGDGDLDLCRYDGGRASTSLSIGKIEGWHLLDRELNNVADISRDADGGYIIIPITPINDTETE